MYNKVAYIITLDQRIEYQFKIMAKSFAELSVVLQKGVQKAEGWDGKAYHIKTDEGVIELTLSENKSGDAMYSVEGEKAETKEGNSSLSVKELKEKLTALAIEIPEGAKKDDLVALLDAAEKSE